jgi:hypothetical protein
VISVDRIRAAAEADAEWPVITVLRQTFSRYWGAGVLVLMSDWKFCKKPDSRRGFIRKALGLVSAGGASTLLSPAKVNRLRVRK